MIQRTELKTLKLQAIRLKWKSVAEVRISITMN